MKQNEKELLALGMEIINGTQVAVTAEECMKSRYIAYTILDIDYIIASHDPATRAEVSKEETAEWAKSVHWKGLEIIATEAGKATDKKGMVEFKATFETNGKTAIHHEKSAFVKINGKWYYHGGLPLPQKTAKDKKIGRNTSCLCGSGKKYKKCCGK